MKNKNLLIYVLAVASCFATPFCAFAQVPEITRTANPIIPKTICFCGHNISLDRFDMYERYDRELTSLVYGHSTTLLTIKRANKYRDVIIKLLRKNNIPEDFFYLAGVESNYNVRAYSPAKAAGMWQFLASTAQQYGLEVNDEVDERYDPEKAANAACKYLKAAYEKFHDWALVAASYNGGQGRITNELASQKVNSFFDLYLTEETSRYVFRIMAMKAVMENPSRYGFSISEKQMYKAVPYTTVQVDSCVNNWCEWAVEHDTNYMTLRELNPWIRKKTLTNKSRKTYMVRIPKDENAIFRSKMRKKDE